MVLIWGSFLEESALKCLVEASIQASKARIGHGEEKVREESQRSRYSPKRETNRDSYSPVPQREKVDYKKTDAGSPVAFNSSAVFFFEVMISISIQNRDRIGCIWPIVSEHIDGILRDVGTVHVVFLGRVVAGVLRLMQRLSYNVSGFGVDGLGVFDGTVVQESWSCVEFGTRGIECCKRGTDGGLGCYRQN